MATKKVVHTENGGGANPGQTYTWEDRYYPGGTGERWVTFYYGGIVIGCRVTQTFRWRKFSSTYYKIEDVGKPTG